MVELLQFLFNSWLHYFGFLGIILCIGLAGYMIADGFTPIQIIYNKIKKEKHDEKN